MNKILFISIDTFRKDTLTRSYNGVDCAPFLKSIKEKSVFYDTYYASCNWTIPSYATMFTGSPTVGHGFWSYIKYPKDPVRLVFEVLADNGIRAGILHSGGPLHENIFQYNTNKYYASAHDVTDLDLTLEQIEKLLDEKEFVFYHTFLQHDYLFHNEYKSSSGIRRPYKFISRFGSWLTARGVKKRMGTRPFYLPPRYIKLIQRMYYNESLLIDAFLKVLITRVCEKFPGIKIVINSDHGECFNECYKKIREVETGKLVDRPLFGHGGGQCYEQFESFLMVYDPSEPSSKIVIDRIDHEDIYDLILSFYGLGIFPKKEKHRHIISTRYNYAGYCGVLEKDEFYIYHKNDEGSLDFLMHDNLYNDPPLNVPDEEVAHYREILEHYGSSGEARSADIEVLARLRSLGYVD